MQIDKYIINNRLNCNVYGSNGELLIGVGTPINDKIRKRLDGRSWYLEKPKKSIYENIVMPEDMIYTKTGDVDMQKLREHAQIIIDSLINNPIVFSNLQKIENYDQYTYNHCTQVAYLAVSMGLRIGLSNRELINLAIAALTHDIGKCLIDENIINKPGKLDANEMDIVRRHSIYGYTIMKKNEDIDEKILEAILYHHENYDGTGYPHRLKEDKIPKEAAIIHICDVFDALVSIRPYKDKMNENDSLNIIKKERGKMFDPYLVDVFCGSMQIFKISSIVELPDGTKVEITNIVKDDLGNVVEIELKELITQKIYVRKR